MQLLSTMYSANLLLCIFSFLFPSGSWVYAQHAVCYYPDRSIVPTYQACNPLQTNGSACCELSNSVCTTGGYCYGNAGFAYRGGRTDPDWASPNCAKHCLNIAQGSFCNLYPCTAGFYTTEFCCGDTTAASDCCSNKFDFGTGNPYAPSQDDTSTSTVSAFSSTSTTSSTSTSSSTQTSSRIGASTNSALSGTSASSLIPSAHTGSKNSTAIGVGIGVPLGLLLLLSLGFLVYRERQRRTMMKSLKREKEAALSNMWQRQPHDGYPMVSNTVLSHELEHTQKAPGELESRSIYEAAANP